MTAHLFSVRCESLEFESLFKERHSIVLGKILRLDARTGTGSGMHANAGEIVSRGQDTQHQTLAVD